MATIDELAVQIAAINRASGEIKRVADDIRKLDQAAGKTGGIDKFNRSFDGLTRFGQNFKRDALAMATGFLTAQAAAQGFQTAIKGTVGAAIGFESSFAGIRKTVDATEAEFDQLAQANRDMAKSLPLSVNGINEIGELAGALGVTGVANIIKFERTIADLANTTNLSAEAAATSFAQIANVLQLPIQEVDRLGSAIVDLGNKGAATESEIVDFSQRIAGAGKIAGLSAADIAGIGSAFASVGIEAEAGGTAIQKVLIEMRKAATQGGAALGTFAQAAGLTEAAFQKLAKSNPAEAFTLFVEGLGKAGDEAFAILAELGLEDQRLIRSFLSAAGAGEVLRQSIETGNKAFAENTALTTEAEKRYATTAAQLQILKNNVTDVGISIGDTLLPAINQSAEGATEFVQAVKPLGATFKAAALGVAAFGAGLAAVKLAGYVQKLQQVIALQLALQRGMGAGATAGAIAGGVGSAGPLIAVTAAVVGLDLALRQFKGEGLISFMTGAKAKAEKAADAQRRMNVELDRLNVLVSERGQDEGRGAFLEEETKRLLSNVDALAAAESRFDAALKPGGNIKPSVAALKDLRAEQKALLDSVLSLNPSYYELNRVLKENPALSGLLSDKVAELGKEYERLAPLPGEVAAEMRDQQIETRKLSDVTADYIPQLTTLASKAGDIAAAYDSAQAAVKKFADVLDIRTLEDITLDRQIAELDALMAGYNQAGADVPADIQKMRDALSAQRSTGQAVEDALVLNFEEIGAAITRAGGDGTKAMQDLNIAITGLPAQTTAEVVTKIRQAELDSVQRILNTLRTTQIPISLVLQLEERGVLERIQKISSQINFLGATKRAEGGIVRKPELALIGEDGPEAVLPLSKPDKMKEILGKIGIPAYGDGKVPSFLDLASGKTGGFTGGQQADRGAVESISAPIVAASNEFAKLAEQLEAAGMGALEFIARLELGTEAQHQAAAAMQETNTAALDLTKLGIVLGNAGISGAAFVAQQELTELRKAFLQSGMSVEEFADSLQGFTKSMLDSAQRVADRTGKAQNVNSIGGGERGSARDIVKDNVRYSAGGSVTDEGLAKLRKRYSWMDDYIKQNPDSVRRVAPTMPGLPRGMSETMGAEQQSQSREQSWQRSGATFNGPVTINARGGIDETLDEMALTMRRR